MPIGGALVKGMIGGALKERAKNIGKTKVGKLVGRESRVMMGKPQPKAGMEAVQPQQTLAPSVPSAGGGGGKSTFATEKEAALSIKTTTIQVATLLKGSYVLEKEQLKNKRKGKEKTKRKSREGLLEKAKGMVSGFKMPKMPGKGLLDSVFGFVGQLVFGMVMMKLVDFLPTLQRILPTLGKIADWIIGAGIWVVDTLANFINWGYKLVDGMENMVKNIFGEEGAEKFKTFMTNVKDLIGAFLVWKLIGKKIFDAVIRNIKIAFNVAKSIVTNAFRLVNFITRGAAGKVAGAVGRGISRFGGRIASKVMGTGVGKLGGSLMKKGVGGLMKRGALKVFGKTFVKAAGKIFGKVPIIGPLIIGIVSLVSGEPLGQALFKTFGAAIGGLLGTFIPIPIIGTLLGETIGVFVGDLLYHLIIKKDPKAAMKMLSDAIMGIFKAGQFIFNFMKDGVTNVIDNFPVVPIPDFRPGDIIAKIMMNIPGGLDILGLEVPWWVPGIGGWSVIGALQNLPGLQEVMGFFAQFIPGMAKYIKSGRLMAIPNLALLTPLGLPFLTPLIAQSFLPGIFGAPKAPEIGEPPKKPEKISAKAIREESKRRKEEALKKSLEAVKGAVSGAWNWMTGGGGDKNKESLRNDALNEKNKGDKSGSKNLGTKEQREVTARFDMKTGTPYINEKAVSVEEYNKFMNLSDKEQLEQYGKSTGLGAKLKNANEQGGAKAVIDSISTTASYEEGSPEVVTVPPPPTTSPSNSPTPSSSTAPLAVGNGGNNDPYEALYKGS